MSDNSEVITSIEFGPSWFPAYYKGAWVAVPLLFIPKDAVDPLTGNLHSVKFTISDGSASSPLETRDCGLAHARIDQAIRGCIHPRLLPEKDLRELCKRYDIPIAWVTGKYPEYKTKQDGLRRELRKNPPLTTSQWKEFIKHLRRIDDVSALIAEIIWYLNSLIGEGGGFVTIEQLLRLTLADVSPDLPGRQLISLDRRGICGTSLITMFLPNSLWKKLCKNLNPERLYVFSNSSGAPLLPQQIIRHFRKAGELAQISEVVSPLRLRPFYDKEAVKKCTRDNSLEPVSQEEWTRLCKLMPELVERRGRKSFYDPLHLLNAIFYKLREKCPYRKLPLFFPHWGATETQYRRWKKNGIFDRILNIRKNNLAMATKSQVDGLLLSCE